MKKKLLNLAAALLMGTTAFAQLPAGSVAPDFTITDINGESHTLQDYLNDGYSVVIDMSATWCGPCWSYHESGALEELWQEHGPAGGQGVNANTTDDVIVIYLESDDETTLDDLYGDGDATAGDWTAGVDFVMADNGGAIAADFGLAYYPTVFTICPNGYLIESGTRTAANHYELIGACQAEDANAGIASYTGEAVADNCDDSEFNVSVDIMNISSQVINSLAFAVNDANGNEIATETFTGDLTTFGITSVDFGALTIESSPIEIVITTDDSDASDNSIQQAISFEVGATDQNVRVELLTDNFPAETYLEIVNGNGETVWSQGNTTVSGNYNTGEENPDEAWVADTLEANTSYAWDVNLSSTGCFTFLIGDYFGDGLASEQWGGVNGSCALLDNNNTSMGTIAFDFGGSTNSLFENGTVSSISEYINSELAVYPNPVNTKANVSFNLVETATVKASLVNVLGETVQTAVYKLTTGSQTITLDVMDVTSGVYFLQLDINGQTSTQKITVTK